MKDYSLLIDLHGSGHRQGPGGDAQTRLALAMSGLMSKPNLEIADIGCGTGASTLVLADMLDARITAVDLLPEFLAILADQTARRGLGDRVIGLQASMDDLPFAASSFDAIWSEGAIYNIGFENGLRAWRAFLKPGGVLAVSELTWLTSDRPAELQRHWDAEYPEVATASRKIAQIEASGYTPIGYFPLPVECWLANYYRPMQQRFAGFLERHAGSPEATAIVAAEQLEIELYERFSGFVSYGFYLARRVL